MATLGYFPMYNSYLEITRSLSDGELGRLVRALMKYSSTGEVEQLNGREAMAFEFIRYDIDRAAKNYMERCERNSANGSKGGRPKNPTVLEKAMGFSETQKSQRESKSKSKSKSNNIPPKSPQGDAVAAFAGEDGVLLAALKNFGAMRKSIKKPMNDTAWKRLFTRLETLSGGNHSTMIALLEQSTEHCWQSVYELKGEPGQAQGANAGFQAGSAELEAVAALKRERERRQQCEL